MRATPRPAGSARTAPRVPRGLVLLFAALSVALVGCVRIEIAIRAGEDGAGEVSGLVAFGGALLPSFPEGFDPFALAASADDVNVEGYREDGFVGVRFTSPFDAPGPDLARAGEIGLPVDFDLRRESGGWRFEAAAPPLREAAAGDLLAGLADFGDLLGVGPAGDGWYRVTLELPGDPSDHNADRVVDGVLVWDLDLADEEPRRLFARTRTASGAAPGAAIGITIAAAAALAVLVAALAAARRRRARAP